MAIQSNYYGLIKDLSQKNGYGKIKTKLEQMDDDFKKFLGENKYKTYFNTATIKKIFQPKNNQKLIDTCEFLATYKDKPNYILVKLNNSDKVENLKSEKGNLAIMFGNSNFLKNDEFQKFQRALQYIKGKNTGLSHEAKELCNIIQKPRSETKEDITILANKFYKKLENLIHTENSESFIFDNNKLLKELERIEKLCEQALGFPDENPTTVVLDNNTVIKADINQQQTKPIDLEKYYKNIDAIKSLPDVPKYDDTAIDEAKKIRGNKTYEKLNNLCNFMEKFENSSKDKATQQKIITNHINSTYKYLTYHLENTIPKLKMEGSNTFLFRGIFNLTRYKNRYKVINGALNYRESRLKLEKFFKNYFYLKAIEGIDVNKTQYPENSKTKAINNAFKNKYKAFWDNIDKMFDEMSSSEVEAKVIDKPIDSEIKNIQINSTANNGQQQKSEQEEQNKYIEDIKSALQIREVLKIYSYYLLCKNYAKQYYNSIFNISGARAKTISDSKTKQNLKNFKDAVNITKDRFKYLEDFFNSSNILYSRFRHKNKGKFLDNRNEFKRNVPIIQNLERAYSIATKSYIYASFSSTFTNNLIDISDTIGNMIFSIEQVMSYLEESTRLNSQKFETTLENSRKIINENLKRLKNIKNGNETFPPFCPGNPDYFSKKELQKEIDLKNGNLIPSRLAKYYSKESLKIQEILKKLFDAIAKINNKISLINDIKKQANDIKPEMTSTVISFISNLFSFFLFATGILAGYANQAMVAQAAAQTSDNWDSD